MKKIYLLILFFFIIILLILIMHSNQEVENVDAEKLHFSTDFENTALYQISNNRDGFSGPIIWKNLEYHNNIGKVIINYEAGNKKQRFAKIVKDPLDSNNSVLMFKINEPHIKEGFGEKGRVSVYVTSHGLKEIHQKVKLYLHPDLDYLKKYDKKITWFTLFEFWNRNKKFGFDDNFRVTVNLEKISKGEVDHLYLGVHGDEQNKLIPTWKKKWKTINTDVPVPIGEWIEIEIYIKEGDNENGRFYLAIIKENQEKEVVFDITNATMHRNDNRLNGFTGFNPMKLYTSDEIINYMKSNDKKLQIYWDDWTLYGNIKPE